MLCADQFALGCERHRPLHRLWFGPDIGKLNHFPSPNLYVHGGCQRRRWPVGVQLFIEFRNLRMRHKVPQVTPSWVLQTLYP